MKINRRYMVLAAAAMSAAALTISFLSKPYFKPESAPGRQELIAAASAGGDYLVRMQKPNGGFYYSYKPAASAFSRDDYNMLRHAGAAYALYQLYAATGGVDYLQSANKAMNFAKMSLLPGPAPGSLYLNDAGKGKLGGAGLGLIALSYRIRFDNGAGKEDAEGLANYILSQQNEDGSYESYLKITGKEQKGSVSLYYPGEAILGLMKLYEIDKNQRWLDSAKRGAKWLIASQRAMKSLPPDAWLVQALEALHKAGPQPEYLEHAIALSLSMAGKQYKLDSKNNPVFKLNSVQASARAEGLAAGWRMARAAGDASETRLGKAVQHTARFLLNNQYGPKEDFPEPELAAGGFWTTAKNGNPEIRIDNVQHSISALLHLADEMK